MLGSLQSVYNVKLSTVEWVREWAKDARGQKWINVIMFHAGLTLAPSVFHRVDAATEKALVQAFVLIKP